jgi:alpha/beta superfamily hydrolase
MSKIIIIIISMITSVAMAKTEKVKFKTKDDLYLNASYFQPDKSLDKSMAILIIEGSGKSGFESEPDNSPFIQLGTELAKNGYHTLSFNKRGSGENSKNGSFWKATFSSDNEDAISALKFLKSQIKPTTKKIFLIGHSFGGPHSLVISNKDHIDGVIMLTSTIRFVGDLQLEQTKIIMELQGAKADVINNELQVLRSQIDSVKIGSFKCEKPRCELIDGAESVDHSIQVPWWKEVLNIDFAKLAKETKTPIHFIFGTSDAIIPETDLTIVKNLIQEHKSTHISYSLLKNLDHFMVENENKKESLNYAMNAQKTKKFKPISQKLILDIINFFKATTK